MMDVQGPPEVGRNDINSPVIPKEESVTAVNLAPSPYAPAIEEVPEGNIFQLSTESFDGEKNPEWVYEQGDIKQVDYDIKPSSPLGAKDEYGNFYPDAVPEGGTILVGGVPMTVKYGEYYDQNAFLFFTSDLRVGTILPCFSLLPSEKYGQGFNSVNTPELHQGTQEKKIFTDIKSSESEEVSYGVALTVVGFPNDILPDREHNGRLVYETPDGFSIIRSGLTETEKGYLAETLVKVIFGKDGKFTFEVLGILKGNSISFDPDSLPEYIAELAGKK
jgi:hypothetical protein